LGGGITTPQAFAPLFRVAYGADLCEPSQLQVAERLLPSAEIQRA
jgi:hypothetical protein